MTGTAPVGGLRAPARAAVRSPARRPMDSGAGMSAAQTRDSAAQSRSIPVPSPVIATAEME